MAKRPTYKSLVKKLDKIFSIYIRLRDRIDGKYCKCVTCGKIIPWKSKKQGRTFLVRGADAGHFMIRGRWNTRWHEKNVHAQCVRCNHWSEGQQKVMAKYIDEKYGAGWSEQLRILSMIRVKIQRYQIEGMIEHYTKKVKEMESEQ